MAAAVPAAGPARRRRATGGSGRFGGGGHSAGGPARGGLVGGGGPAGGARRPVAVSGSGRWPAGAVRPATRWASAARAVGSSAVDGGPDWRTRSGWRRDSSAGTATGAVVPPRRSGRRAVGLGCRGLSLAGRRARARGRRCRQPPGGATAAAALPPGRAPGLRSRLALARSFSSRGAGPASRHHQGHDGDEGHHGDHGEGGGHRTTVAVETRPGGTQGPSARRPSAWAPLPGWAAATSSGPGQTRPGQTGRSGRGRSRRAHDGQSGT